MNAPPHPFACTCPECYEASLRPLDLFTFEGVKRFFGDGALKAERTETDEPEAKASEGV
jgi:hypothetical protein